MSVLERILNLDFRLFYQLNGVWTNQYFDNLFPYLRESILWIPLYLFLLLFSIMNFGLKGLYWVIVFLCLASLCDIVSSHIVKELVFRPRPCRTPSLAGQMRLLVIYCPQSSSFVSSHATNHFGAAMFIFATWKSRFPKWTVFFFVWAALIAYAQVYVGVHFPIDVFCGSLLGIMLGAISGKVYNRYIGLSGPALANQ